MKQKITNEQASEILELSQEATSNFIKFAEKHGLSIRSSSHKTYYPRLSIGQMIEFLERDGRPVIIQRHSQWHGDGWSVLCIKELPTKLTMRSFDTTNITTVGTELSDALWKAVKEVL